MSCFPSNWFDWTIIACATGGVFWGCGAYFFARKHTYPRDVRATGLTGTVKEFSKIAVTSSGAGLVTGVLSKDLDQYLFFKQAMLAVLVVSIFAAICSYFMGAALDPHISDDGKTIKLKTHLWEVLHGIIFGSTFIGMITVLFAMVALASELRG